MNNSVFRARMSDLSDDNTLLKPYAFSLISHFLHLLRKVRQGVQMGRLMMMGSL